MVKKNEQSVIDDDWRYPPLTYQGCCDYALIARDFIARSFIIREDL